MVKNVGKISRNYGCVGEIQKKLFRKFWAKKTNGKLSSLNYQF